ncbi:Tetraspanin family [Nesidiocoris tenuis]|uniref:Tetraspanin family n=1 Tax=Nesidiocoris tenuis TaxID=355587 RepID=A0ABN7AKC4_9HEMI|nr:Tetraspanin family [Nesidiocoris tenuis]
MDESNSSDSDIHRPWFNWPRLSRLFRSTRFRSVQPENVTSSIRTFRHPTSGFVERSFHSSSPYESNPTFWDYEPDTTFWDSPHESRRALYNGQPAPTPMSKSQWDRSLRSIRPLLLNDYVRPYGRFPGQNSGESVPDRSGGGTMNCGTCFAKYLLCLFNFVLFLAGGLALALGVWLYFDPDSLMAIMNTIHENIVAQLSPFSHPYMMTYIGYCLMATGCFIFIMSLLGYCGALRESKCLLGFYGFLVILILVLEITAVCMAFIYKDRADGVVKDFLKSSIKDYYITKDSNHPEIAKGPTAVWDEVMIKLSCCGVNNHTDFSMSMNVTNSGFKVPPACCRMNGTSSLLDPNCPRNPQLENSYYLTGCYPTLMNLISDHMNIIIYCVIGVILVELLTAFVAICLCKTLEPPYDK